MYFKKLEKDTWERASAFKHFMKELRCVMSMTVELDITDFLSTLHEKEYSFYPAMMWVVCRAVNRREEFRMGYDQNGNVGVWKEVSPYYAHFYKEDEKFVKLVTEYSADFSVFYQRFLEDKRRYQQFREFQFQPIPPNTFDVSCLPWVHYQCFDIHVFDSGTYLAPVVTWGKYLENDKGRITMPLSMNIHHAVADGFHLSRFFSDVEDEMAVFIKNT